MLDLPIVMYINVYQRVKLNSSAYGATYPQPGGSPQFLTSDASDLPAEKFGGTYQDLPYMVLT